MAGRPRVAVSLWRICGLGGVGCVYGYTAGRAGVPAEPIPVVRAAAAVPVETLISASWHAVFWAAAEYLDRRVP